MNTKNILSFFPENCGEMALPSRVDLMTVHNAIGKQDVWSGLLEGGERGTGSL